MNRHSISLHNILFGLVFFVLVACGQKVKSNPPEITQALEQRLSAAPFGSYIVYNSGTLARIASTSPNERDNISLLSGSFHNGKYSLYQIKDISGLAFKVVYPDDDEYVSYEARFYGGKMSDLYASGQSALVILYDGTIGKIISPSEHGALSVSWPKQGTIIEDRYLLSQNILRVVPATHPDYSRLEKKYRRGETGLK
jgi:hypothetical protein